MNIFRLKFSDRLLGIRGNQFERWCGRLEEQLSSDSHGEYSEGIEQLGQILGFEATRPKYSTATDCRWRGIFANRKELVTFEAKIEQQDGHIIPAAWFGQAHNQHSRAELEFGPFGYIIRSTIITHITNIESAAQASAGPIKILMKDSILKLWQTIRILLSTYRDNWSLHDIPARIKAATAIKTKIPPTGWMIRALDTSERIIPADIFLAEWVKSR